MSERPADVEKRKYKRVNVSFTVVYEVNSPLSVRMKVNNKEVNAIALDLSEGGIAVLTSYDIPKLTLVKVKFIIFNENALNKEERSRWIEVKGEVRYNISTKEKAFRVGVCFVGISAADRTFIADFVKMLITKTRRQGVDS